MPSDHRNPSIHTLREAAKDLLHKNGWRPGDALCLHSVTCLMAEMAYRASQQEYTCDYPTCGCCADAACPDANHSKASKGGGFAVVPVEPTGDMIDAGRDAARKVQRSGVSGMTIEAQLRAEGSKEIAIYKAMLAAAPTPPAGGASDAG